MICKKCRQKIDDRYTQCPFCGCETGVAAPNANGYNTNDNKAFTGGFTDVQTGGKSIFDTDDYDDNEEIAEVGTDEEESESEENNSRYKYIVAGLTVAIIAFVIVLLCILYFSGVIGGKPEETTTEEITTVEVLATSTPVITTTEKPTTTVPTSIVTAGDYGEGIAVPKYITLNVKKGTVTATALNMRKAPTSEEDNLVTSLSEDTEVVIYGADKAKEPEWYLVYLESESAYGWVYASYISCDKITFNAVGTSVKVKSNTDNKTTTDNLEVTTNPMDNTTDIYGTTTEQTSEIISTTEKQTTTEEETTTEQETTTEEETTTEKETTAADSSRSTPSSDVKVPENRDEEKTYVVTAESGLKLRSTPDSSTEENYIMLLSKGIKVEVSKIEEGWAYVYFEGSDCWGWVSQSYIEAEQ